MEKYYKPTRKKTRQRRKAETPRIDDHHTSSRKLQDEERASTTTNCFDRSVTNWHEACDQRSAKKNIAVPETRFKLPLEIFPKTHFVRVTYCIQNKLYILARKVIDTFSILEILSNADAGHYPRTRGLQVTRLIQQTHQGDVMCIW